MNGARPKVERPARSTTQSTTGSRRGRSRDREKEHVAFLASRNVPTAEIARQVANRIATPFKDLAKETASRLDATLGDCEHQGRDPARRSETRVPPLERGEPANARADSIATAQRNPDRGVEPRCQRRSARDTSKPSERAITRTVRTHQDRPDRRAELQTGEPGHRWRSELTRGQRQNQERPLPGRPTRNHPAAPIAEPGTETTTLRADALSSGSVTLSHRHEIAADLRQRRLAALNRAALYNDEAAGYAADAAERTYDAHMSQLLRLPDGRSAAPRNGGDSS